MKVTPYQKQKNTTSKYTSPLFSLKMLLALVLFVFMNFHAANAQQVKDTSGVTLVYKTVDTLQLHLKVYHPDHFDKTKSYPAIIFFYGGGWINGTLTQFKNQALYLASRGMVTVLAEYRVSSRNNTTPFEAVSDAKSAIRYLRANSGALGIRQDRIAAAGGSAGGHLAAAADLTKLDEPLENQGISSRPDALVLFNPVFNNGPGEYGYDRIKERYPEISPFHNIVKGAAPTVIFLGTKDKLVSVPTAEAYKNKMIQAGNRCELFLYEGQVHGFFNKGEYYDKTLRQADLFLESLGYISGKPQL